MSEHLRRQWHQRVQVAKIAFSAPIPAKVRAKPPEDLYAPRPVKIEQRAEGDIRHLDTDDEGVVRDMIREIARGKVRLERKERPPLEDCYSADAGHSVRILLYCHVDGTWRVFYVGYHDYDVAENRLERAAGLYTFDVTYAEHKDAIMDGRLADGVSRVTVEADDIIDAQLLAEQMVAAQGWEPTDTLAISWPEEHWAKTAKADVLEVGNAVQRTKLHMTRRDLESAYAYAKRRGDLTQMRRLKADLAAIDERLQACAQQEES